MNTLTDCFLFLASPDPTVRRLRCRVLQRRLKRLPEQITVPSHNCRWGSQCPEKTLVNSSTQAHKMYVWQVSLPLVELLVTRSHTLHLQLVSTASALSSFLDTLQTLADTASNSKGILTAMRIVYFLQLFSNPIHIQILISRYNRYSGKR